MSFWLSHVPHGAVRRVLGDGAARAGARRLRVRRRLGARSDVDGRESSDARPRRGIVTRKLDDGREFRIVKVFWDPMPLADRARADSASTARHRRDAALFHLRRRARDRLIAGDCVGMRLRVVVRVDVGLLRARDPRPSRVAPRRPRAACPTRSSRPIRWLGLELGLLRQQVADEARVVGDVVAGGQQRHGRPRLRARTPSITDLIICASSLRRGGTRRAGIRSRRSIAAFAGRA